LFSIGQNVNRVIGIRAQSARASVTRPLKKKLPIRSGGIVACKSSSPEFTEIQHEIVWLGLLSDCRGKEAKCQASPYREETRRQ
jgi:hypothetical protein